MQYDLALVQSKYNTPVLSDLSNEGLGEEIAKAVEDAKCWLESRTYTPDTEGNDEMENIPPQIHATNRHHSGDTVYGLC
jgi:hypothetical protein